MKHDPELTRLLLLNLRDGGHEEQINKYPKQLVLEQKARLIDEGLATGAKIKNGLELGWVKGLRISTFGHQWLETREASGGANGVAPQTTQGGNVPPLETSHVFISYVRENDIIVDRLCNELRRAGIDVWRDRDKIQPGQRWQQVIRRAIERGAFFLACFSAEYNARESTYMNEELTLAIEELRKRPTDRTWFIPVLLSNCAIPDRDVGAGETLRHLQYVSLLENWEEGVRRIVSALKSRPTSLLTEINSGLHGSPPQDLGLSEQAIFILRQFVESGDDQFFYANWGGGQWTMQLCHGEQQQLGVTEPQFIQDDLNDLASRGFLRVEYNADGHGIYHITRNAVRFIHALEANRKSS